MQPIQVALTAYGMSGKVFHGPLLKVNPHFQLRKVWERKTEHSKAVHPQVEVVRRYEDVLADPEIELVVINTPHDLHFQMARQALEAGKHVVVEKPFTVTTAEAQELIDLAHRKELLLTVFHNRRWDGDFLTVQQVVKGNFLGPLVEFEAHYDRFRNYVEPNSWKEAGGPGSGLLYNLGPHLIDQALVLFGPPHSVTADIGTQRPGATIDDNYHIILHYNRLRVILRTSYLVREQGPRYTLHGLEGSFLKWGIDPQEDALKAGRLPTEPGWGTEPEQWWGLLNTQVNGLHVTGKVETLPGNYQRFYENIYQVLRHGAELAVKPEDALRVMQVIEAATESSRLKQTVQFPA